MLDEIPIADAEGYIARMAKSMIDKIFFLDKIDVDAILDYGCADGALMRAVHAVAPEVGLVGYDLAPEMIARAEENAPNGAVLTADWDTALAAAKAKGRTALVLSSVIHEVYSYGSEIQIAQFWDRVFGSGFDAIVIRDMCVSHTASRPSDPLIVARVRQLADPTRLAEWEATWGSIAENWSLVHWFLTCRYTDNWARELKENYLPLPVEVLLAKAPERYVPALFEHYTLPWLRRAVMDDFGIQLQERTHIKLIFERT